MIGVHVRDAGGSFENRETQVRAKEMNGQIPADDTHDASSTVSGGEPGLQELRNEVA